MSLINDALKRAKEGENKGPAPVSSADKPQISRETPMRPVETRAQPSASPTVYILSAALVLVLVGAGVLLWMWNSSSQKRTPVQPGAVVAVAPAKPAPVATPGQHPPESKPVIANVPEVKTASTTPPTVSTAPNPDTKLASAISEPARNPTEVIPVAEKTNAVVLQAAAETPPAELVAPAVPVVPQFPQLKLQGIFYNPTKPSTVINGKTYTTGGAVAGARIVKIEIDKVTVEWNGETRVLETAQ